VQQRTPTTLQLALPDAAHTHALALAIARVLEPGDIIELSGSMGSGKTTFTAMLAAALGSTDIVRSPTYTVAHVYELPGGASLAHLDAWRHQHELDASEWGDLAPALEATWSCIEWPQALAPWIADRRRWSLELVHAGDGRRLARVTPPTTQQACALVLEHARSC
jgi:tRNA threonylcarbamoyladenosine biosynthesis protein TsaE